MALLLDKLAKENQDIRLLQAQLQVDMAGGARPGRPSLGRGSDLVSSSKEVSCVFPHTLTSPLSHYSQVTFLVLCSHPSC